MAVGNGPCLGNRPWQGGILKVSQCGFGEVIGMVEASEDSAIVLGCVVRIG